MIETRLLDARASGALAEAAELVRAGGLIAFPTDTVYGVGARAFDGVAVAELYVAKERPPEKQIPVLLADAADVWQVARAWPEDAQALADAFWPGALTLIVPRHPDLPRAVSADDTVAVRVPDHAVARALIRAVGVPLATTSANRSGQPSATTAAEAWAALSTRIACVLDGGTAPGGVPSTIVDVTVRPARVLRWGALTRAALAAVVALASEVQ